MEHVLAPCLGEGGVRGLWRHQRRARLHSICPILIKQDLYHRGLQRRHAVIPLAQHATAVLTAQNISQRSWLLSRRNVVSCALHQADMELKRKPECHVYEVCKDCRHVT